MARAIRLLEGSLSHSLSTRLILAYRVWSRIMVRISLFISIIEKHYTEYYSNEMV